MPVKKNFIPHILSRLTAKETNDNREMRPPDQLALGVVFVVAEAFISEGTKAVFIQDCENNILVEDFGNGPNSRFGSGQS